MEDVKAFREEHGIEQRQMARIIKELFSGYDKQLQCKVENPDRYGVRLVSDAERFLEQLFPETITEPSNPAPAPRRTDKRKLSERLQFRVSKAKRKRLQQAFRADGYDTMQGGMQHITDLYLEKRKEVKGHDASEF